MFQSLRVGTTLYVLHKNEPRIEQGEVVFVSNPVPQFGQTFNAGMLTPPQMTVDVNIKVEGKEKPIEIKQLPAAQTIADYGNGMVISESKEAISNEIAAVKANSIRVIESIDQHKGIIQKCDSLLEQLNPEIRKDAERSRELETLSSRVGGLESSLGRIEELLARTLNTKAKEK